LQRLPTLIIANPQLEFFSLKGIQFVSVWEPELRPREVRSQELNSGPVFLRASGEGMQTSSMHISLANHRQGKKSSALVRRLSDEAVGTAICSGVLTLVCVNGVPENKRLLGSVFRTTTDLFMALYSLKCPGKTVACLNLKNFSVTQHHQQTGVLPGDCIFHLQERGVDAALSFTFRCSSEDEAQRWVRSAGYVTPAPRRASLCQVSLPSVEEAPEFLQPVSASHHFLHGSAAAVAAAARGGD
ncbi:unnamed protein product, partial [Notodromas monacha]